jgi:hypothetical protein
MAGSLDSKKALLGTNPPGATAGATGAWFAAAGRPTAVTAGARHRKGYGDVFLQPLLGFVE